MDVHETTDRPAPRRIALPKALIGLRLDRALVELLPGISRTRLKELIVDGGVWFEGECLRRPAMRIEVVGNLEIKDVPRVRERPGAAPGVEPEIVFEDEHLAVIEKPAGQITHPTSVVRGGSVSEWATSHWRALPAPQGDDRPGIVHRLDSDTSGLMVLAKSERAAPLLLEAFRERKVDKGYLALVHGDPRFDSDWIEAPIGRSRKRSDRMSVIEAPVLRHFDHGSGESDEAENFVPGLEASTFYITRERLGRFALIECRPKTGRMHQIRVHLTHIGHPLVGDRVYSGRNRVAVPREAPPLKRHALHASALAFLHPVTGEEMKFERDMPADMEGFLQWARQKTG